jgi:hypothetical protein
MLMWSVLTLLILVMGVLVTQLVSVAQADNLITVEQVTSGNSNSFSIEVDGSDNTVDISYGGAGNSVSIKQHGDNQYVGYTTAWGSGAGWGGDLDGDNNNLNVTQTCNQSPCGGDKFEFHIVGNSNDVDFYQGHRVDADGTLHSIDDYEYGGHFTRLDIHGSNNKFLGSQRSNNSGHEHSNITNIYGSNNDVYTRQESNQDKSINLTINNSGNDVDIIQGGGASHSATVSLTGAYSTDLDLTQYSSTAQTYTLTQNCQTLSGCSVGVTQN